MDGFRGVTQSLLQYVTRKQQSLEQGESYTVWSSATCGPTVYEI
jgi:hypothetical protein